jgi:hypothetical protein
MLAASLIAALLGARPAAPTISIYVGPMVRDGFVDVDRGLADSTRDIKKALIDELHMLRKADYRLVDQADSADVALYVMNRGEAPTGDSSTITVPGQVFTLSSGQTLTMPSASFQVAAKTHYVETILRVGDYVRPFVNDDRHDGRWSACARRLAKDVATWLAANRDRLSRK